MKIGDTLTYERTFTIEEVEQFGRLSGDLGQHHVVPDEQGRVMVHGFLTASLITKIGGDVNYIASEFEMEFLRPVFTGDTVSCELTVTGAEEFPSHFRVQTASVLRNQSGKEVMRASSNGIIRKKQPVQTS